LLFLKKMPTKKTSELRMGGEREGARVKRRKRRAGRQGKDWGRVGPSPKKKKNGSEGGEIES